MINSDRFFPLEDDFRDPYARDRDRIVHSQSFRKLEYKTQVFLNHEGDFFRTRLTHSLEVSQVARSIARELGLNETLAEAIALSHDLGHTPFGHVGGDELNRVLRASGHVNGFEHNFQSFRVVTNLEKRYKNFDGLNLTYATLEGILKHSFPYKKEFLTPWHEEFFSLDLHPSFEAVVVDFADEIAYISHDIDDGLNSGLIGFDLLMQSRLIQTVYKRVHDEGIEPEEDELFRYRFSSHLINFLVYALLDYSLPNLLKIDNSSHIRAEDKLPIGYEKGLRKEIKKLKKILFKNLYRHEKIARRMFAGKTAIKGLYDAFIAEEELLPTSIRVRLSSTKKHRVVADYIASLSDRNAMQIFNELYGKLN